MKVKKQLLALALCCSLSIGCITPAFADSSSVVTLGTDLSDEQKQTVLDYFGVKKDEVVVLEVNNSEERKYLQGVATEAQLGTKTFSCAYVQPTKTGNGINVKTANLTYVTSSMIASTLTTCGVTDANVIAMTPLSGGVSGTGALTGVMKAFEDATGEKLDEEKKELASEELVTTGDLGDEIGQDKATGVMNDIKSEIIKNGTQDTVQIADTINNVTNNYNVTLTPEQEKQIESLMTKIAAQDYDYDKLKNTFDNVSDGVGKNLESLGIKVKNSGMWDSIKKWFQDVFSSEEAKDLGILETTNDSVLGENAQVDATDEKAVPAEVKEANDKNKADKNQAASSEQKEEGFWTSVGRFFDNLFGSSDSSSDNKTNTDTKNDKTSETNTNSTSENKTSEIDKNTDSIHVDTNSDKSAEETSTNHEDSSSQTNSAEKSNTKTN